MADAETTARKRLSEIGRATQFQPGNPGRPKGSRNKLGEAFIEALHDDFNEHGVAAIQQARLDSPIKYVKVIASLLPSEHKITFTEQYEAMTDAELAARARQLATAIAPLLADGVGATEAGTSGTDSPAVASRVH